MTSLTTAAPATRTVAESDRVPPLAGSQLQRDRAFLRMGLASFTGMQDAGAHHRRKRIRSPSVTRFPATLPRASGGSSASSSGQDAGRSMVQPQRAAPPAEPALQIMPPVTVMTSNRARHEHTGSVKVRLLGTRLQSGGTVPDLSGDGLPGPSPSPICPESGDECHYAPQSPSPICRVPRPRFPSGGPRPARGRSDQKAA
jgi:hypothetical protein